MRMLLDTHAFLWFVGGSHQLSAAMRVLIEDKSNTVCLSLASLWELAIKVRLGRFQLNQPFEQFVLQQITNNEITLLDITVSHIALVASLPLHHRDPFDRLLVAQAQAEQLPLVSTDEALDAYSIQRSGEAF